MQNRLDDDEDGTAVLRDGEKLNVPIYLMDGVREVAFDASLHRPGYRVADQAALDRSEQAYQERNRRISGMWRTKDRAAADSEAACEAGRDEASGADPRTAALAARDAWLRNAWRKA
jgi:hypothetical protein